MGGEQKAEALRKARDCIMNGDGSRAGESQASHSFAPPPFGMQSMEQMVVDLDKTTLRPVQRESYLCMARCCDSADSPVQLQQCVQRCEQSIQARHAVIQATMGDFQNRLQRCVGRCQDAAQESLPASSGDKDIRKAQVLDGGGGAIGWATCASSACPWSPDAGTCTQVPCLHRSPFMVPTREHSSTSAQEMLESCAGNCAAEYERQIPKLKKTIVDSLKNVQS